ncbi:protein MICRORCHIDIA 7-like isoform X2 [Humulus lupulus]|uniref:protein MICRORCHIDIA 7-like isoform X2 n=1 Tax=Humulus lupulus TaxID=3486 RepID=UPI002B414992|nr:protein MICRORCHIDIA 7-like isoform X2 [Humulus lupulus]
MEVKEEPIHIPAGEECLPNGAGTVVKKPSPSSPVVIDSDSDSDEGEIDGNFSKIIRMSELALPVAGLLYPSLPLLLPEPEVIVDRSESNLKVASQGCKQFWKAGDYEFAPSSDWTSSAGGMDHVRVHPKFLHSNATSHKWALGAFAELLDNALDEVCSGATYANIDMLTNKKDGSRMLLIEDNGGGMNPDKMRHCMSLGYSEKSKLANTIGQYGNGFKTSTMRLGADVIVFSRCQGNSGKSVTKSVGLLSYTFLRSTGKEDIVVPMLDYEMEGDGWSKMVRSSLSDWNKNLETIVQWSPFCSEGELLKKFSMIKGNGSRIYIYNLWEDDQGQLELDFDYDPHDIQIRGVNRDEKSIQMAKQYPNSRHFLTYRHSLRSYASILYLRLPPSFRIILRGKDVEHHNIVNDMMLSEKIKYRPQPGAEGISKDVNMIADVTIGFVKDAKHHIDVQGFNVYHKNRLIKPFWRLWNAAGSAGRGVIGVLEANFVEPAHDKQGFERTTVLSRLEARLVQMQKNYWSCNCHKIGYHSNRMQTNGFDREKTPDSTMNTLPMKRKSDNISDTSPASVSEKIHSHSNQKGTGKGASNLKSSAFPPTEQISDNSDDIMYTPVREKYTSGNNNKAIPPERTFGSLSPPVTRKDCASSGRNVQFTPVNLPKKSSVGRRRHSSSDSESESLILEQLRKENAELKDQLDRIEGDVLGEVLQDLQYERDRCTSLESQLEASQQKIDELNKEKESLIDFILSQMKGKDEEVAGCI